MAYFVYIVRCADNTLYTGITTDVMRRVEQHNQSDLLGAKYTRYRRPVFVVYQKKMKTRSVATKEELRIKKLSRKQKDHLIASWK